MNCDQVRELALEFAEGALSGDDSRAVEIHLHACRGCAAHIRETRALLGDLHAARDATELLSASAIVDGTRAPQSSSAIVAPPARLGDFDLFEILGAGGMGTVFRARQVTLNRIVALKVMRPAPGEAATFLQRFQREAQAAARLHHTNIVPVYAQGAADGYVYYAMELINGPSLAQDIARQAEARRAEHSLSRGPTRDFKQIARLFAEVAEGLAHAHELGIIHRDIKAQNLLLDGAGRLHITDFGLARVIAEPGLTLTSEMMGTPAYMAPEQITHGGKSVDGRSDVWSLGVTLYEYLALRKPFSGDSAQQIIHRIIHDEPPPPRKCDAHIPLDLEIICLRALEKEPTRRFATAAEFAADLRRFAGDYAIASRRISLPGRAVRWCRRNPAKATALVAAALIGSLTPVTWRLYNAAANARIDRAWEIQLNDYHDQEAALTALGWAESHGGDRLRAQTLAAWARWSGEAPAALEEIQRLSRAAPRDADLHFLLAWGYARRASQGSSQNWAYVMQEIEAGDHCEAPTAAGWFFRGQALQGLNPREADRSFEEAIKARMNFTQAILLQARAANQYMYLARDLKNYGRTVSGLETVAKQQPTRAYPRYLLARTHTIAGEIYAHLGQSREAQSAMSDGLAAALAAQQAEADNPRGYIAEGQCLESQNRLEDALRVYDRVLSQPLRMRPNDWLEASIWGMRAAFALGQDGRAEELRRIRYATKSGYSGTPFDPDEVFYEALIAATRGRLDAARIAISAGVPRVGDSGDDALRLAGAAALVGVNFAAPIQAPHGLPPSWDAEWYGRFRALLSGTLEWSVVESQLPDAAGDAGFGRRNFLESAGCWYAGLRALATGQRAAARSLFERGARVTDNEDYCFRARCLLLRMDAEEGWPGWIAVRH